MSGFQAGNTYGRKAGVPNRLTKEARALAGRIINDPLYLKNLMERAQKGMLPPAIEMMLWAYTFGKPVESIEVTTHQGNGRDLADLTDEQLAEMAANTAREAALLVQERNNATRDTTDDIPFAPSGTIQ